MGVLKSEIERFGNSPKIAPTQELTQPDKYLQRCTEFVASYQACLLDSAPPYKTSHRRCRRLVFDILKHPIQGFTLDRGGEFNVIASASKPTVAIDGCVFWFLIRGTQ